MKEAHALAPTEKKKNTALNTAEAKYDFVPGHQNYTGHSQTTLVQRSLK